MRSRADGLQHRYVLEIVFSLPAAFTELIDPGADSHRSCQKGVQNTYVGATFPLSLMFTLDRRPAAMLSSASLYVGRSSLINQLQAAASASLPVPSPCSLCRIP